jgi:hypothetical protein
MPKETIEALQGIKISDPMTFLTISLIALRSSVNTYHTFIDYDAHPGPEGYG